MKLIAAMAIIGSCLAGPAMAAGPFDPTPLVQADLDLYGGFSLNGATGFGGRSAAAIGGGGRANIALAGQWNLQGDVQFITRASEGAALSEGEHYVHFYKRDPANYAIGVYGGFYSPGGFAGRVVGIEVQKYLGAWTFYGQASIGILDTGGPTSDHPLQFRGQVSYFLGPNASIAGDVMSTSFHDGSLPDVLTLALTGMYRLDHSPFAIYAQARYDRFSDNSGALGSQTSGLVGLRLNVDPSGSTVLSHGRTGPAMNVMPLIPRQINK